jgi:hypothetical protein
VFRCILTNPMHFNVFVDFAALMAADA